MLNNQINKNFDWNVGSILQHFDAAKVVNILKGVNNVERIYLYDMIGIMWVLGEFKFKDQFVIELLQDTIKYTRNPEVWWRAAFSLEKITKDMKKD